MPDITRRGLVTAAAASLIGSRGWAGANDRIRIAIGELCADREWPVKGYRPSIEAALPEGFHITAKGLIRRKGVPA